MSTVEQPHEPSGFPPYEALRRARPLPPGDQLVIEDRSDDEWAAFQQALAHEAVRWPFGLRDSMGDRAGVRAAVGDPGGGLFGRRSVSAHFRGIWLYFWLCCLLIRCPSQT